MVCKANLGFTAGPARILEHVVFLEGVVLQRPITIVFSPEVIISKMMGHIRREAALDQLLCTGI